MVDEFRNHNCSGRPMVYRSMLTVYELDAIVVFFVSRDYRHEMRGGMVEMLSQDVDG